MSLTEISSQTGIPLETLKAKCLRKGKNPNAIFSKLDFEDFKWDFDAKTNTLLVASKINFEQP